MQYYGDDLDWLMRARELGVSVVIPEQVTLLYRMHEQNTSRDQTIRHRGPLEVLKKSLDRRRTQRGNRLKSLPKFSDFQESVIRGRKHSEL